LEEFDRLHVATTGERAVINGGKDAALLTRLCKTHGEARIRELLAAFFRSTDPFIQQAGYTVGVFYSQVAKLIAKGRSPTTGPTYSGGDWYDACRHEPKCQSGYQCGLRGEATA